MDFAQFSASPGLVDSALLQLRDELKSPPTQQPQAQVLCAHPDQKVFQKEPRVYAEPRAEDLVEVRLPLLFSLLFQGL